MNNVAVFASGSGSNAENIAKYFFEHESISIKLFLSNKSDAYVLERAKKLNIKSVFFNKEQFKTQNYILNILEKEQIDFIVLAGFLWLIPKNLIDAYPNKIINIHPALLPKYGGKGMFGDNVHKAVIKNNDTESGITIHFVNEKYDDGNIIFQAKCKINDQDTYQSLADKVHQLEYNHYPKIIENLLTK